MRVLVTGSSGFIGTALGAALRRRGDEIVPVVRKAPALGEVGLDLGARRLDPSRLPGHTLDGAGIDAAVHLAGASLVGRWTAPKKEAIRQSRIAVGDIVARALAAMDRPPAVLVSGSAIGYYGDTGEPAVDEGDGSGVGFLPEVCRAWEESANPAREANIRVVNVRTGIVLGDGGVLKLMLPAFRFGLGARVGSGRQWTSWISLEDEVRILLRAVDDTTLAGPLNATAPTPVRNAELTAEIAATVHRPSVLAVPAPLLRAVLGKAAADETLLVSQRVLSRRLIEADFAFRHETVASAVAAALRT
jgi:uncharacterized protein (TIGR01777 family)